jgi:hypothetical protein
MTARVFFSPPSNPFERRTSEGAMSRVIPWGDGRRGEG